jgi:prepilin-type processing-associated H-X9-DG protein
MEFLFPPAPPNYDVVIYARVVLVACSLISVTVLAWRVRNWKSIRRREIILWWLAAIVSGVVSTFAISRYVYDGNQRLALMCQPTLVASAAGIIIGLLKIHKEGTARERKEWIGWNAVVVICLVLWTAMDLTKLRHPIAATHRTVCRQNLKEVGRAMHTHHEDKNGFPPAASGLRPVSWRVILLPYVEEQAVYDRYHRGSAWDEADNLPLARERMKVFSCPADYYPRNTDGQWYTAYSMPTGVHSVGANPKGTKLGDITDGTSNTLLIVEACGAQIVWTEPRDVNIDLQPDGINLNGNRPGSSAGWLSSYHANGTHVAFADGAVRFLSQTIDADVLKKLATIDGGEQVDDF